MKNIEKYTKTRDAVKAWEEYGDCNYVAHGVRGFDFKTWLQCECVEPRRPTLLEAAERLIIEYVNDWQLKGIKTIRCMEDLREAVKSEKQKPVRNVDRYATAEEASRAFVKMCRSHKYCVGCPFREATIEAECVIAWLYAAADAGKEAAR